MADQVTGIAGGATGTGLGGITGALQGGVSNLVNTGSGILDKWFPPEKREQLKSMLTKFATERPKLAAFILSQVALSGGPLLLFVVMSLTVLIFALLAGIIVGVVGALLFTVFCVGVALIVLLPTLFFTTAAACFIFLWGIGAYYIVKWFNQKDVPGVHTALGEGSKKQMGLDGVPALNGELPGLPAEKSKGKPLQEKDTNAHGHATSGEDKENTPPHSTAPAKPKRSQTPSQRENRPDVPAVGDVKKKAGGITSGIGI